jgi:hypothetical protein
MLGDKEGSGGETALMALCRTGTKETVELLLRLDTRKGLKDDYWKTALGPKCPKGLHFLHDKDLKPHLSYHDILILDNIISRPGH